MSQSKVYLVESIPAQLRTRLQSIADKPYPHNGASRHLCHESGLQNADIVRVVREATEQDRISYKWGWDAAV